MINLIKRYKFNILLRNIKVILKDKKYILKDMFFNNNWYCFLFFDENLFVIKKYVEQKGVETSSFFPVKEKEMVDKNLKIIKFNNDELYDFNCWLKSEDKNALMELIKKSHVKKYKSTFAIEGTEHMLENLSTFLIDRENQVRLNKIEIQNVLKEFLLDKYAHLYTQNDNQIINPSVGLD